jgi:hypothetical protein
MIPRIQLLQDPDIEPGHQWLAAPNDPQGHALATLLLPAGEQPETRDRFLYIPHNRSVDQNIVDLINALAHVRFQSPTLVQLTLQVAPPSDGGPEDA